MFIGGKSELLFTLFLFNFMYHWFYFILVIDPYN
jgi:hypothetical protein